VPAEVKSRLYTQARYDEEQEEWNLSASLMNDNQLLRRPVSTPGKRRPISEYATQMIKQNGDATRYKVLKKN